MEDKRNASLPQSSGDSAERIPEVYPPISRKQSIFKKHPSNYSTQQEPTSPNVKNKKKSKCRRGNSIVPINESEKNDEEENLIQEPDLRRFQTERGNPNENRYTSIARSRTTSDHHGQAQRIIKVARCPQCNRLSYFENDVCCYCKHQGSDGPKVKSFLFISAFCCCLLSE
ncbi:unnamed protein product [Blepharisma stoltei]|uniref:Uncharacterized protein n=1 Tax=Blepharisma stoltei TaxID=1481888 RepID=A0AAU9JW17_9CILI|nr:unnamed protein product [Blepharisma stoltei]